jgi:hypothetical protein
MSFQYLKYTSITYCEPALTGNSQGPIPTGEGAPFPFPPSRSALFSPDYYLFFIFAIVVFSRISQSDCSNWSWCVDSRSPASIGPLGGQLLPPSNSPLPATRLLRGRRGRIISTSFASHLPPTLLPSSSQQSLFCSSCRDYSPRRTTR